MKNLGYRIENFPFANHKKVCDLITYDGPILSHFTNEQKENYLYYWIDQEEKINRWLIFKLDLGDLRQYLYGGAALRELILSEKNQYLFIGDIENQKDKFILKEIRLIENHQLIDDYLPETDSFFSFSIPQLYESFFDRASLLHGEYVSLLKERAVFMKLSSTELAHRGTLTLTEISNFINSIRASFNSYLEDSFKRNFTKLFIDLKDLQKTVGRVQDNLQPRMVDVKSASFGIAFTPDTVMLSQDFSNEIRSWSTEIITDYRNEVVELDYENVDNLDNLLKNYTPEARRNIFKPILDIYSNPKFQVSVTRKNFEAPRSLKKPSGELIRRLTEVPVLILEQRKPDKEFLTIAVEVNKGTELSSIPKKQFSSQPLFEKRSDSSEMIRPFLDYKGNRISFKKPLSLNVTFKNSLHILSIPNTEIAATGSELEEAIEAIGSAILKNWHQYIEDKKKGQVSTPSTKVIGELIDSVTPNA